MSECATGEAGILRKEKEKEVPLFTTGEAETDNRPNIRVAAGNEVRILVNYEWKVNSEVWRKERAVLKNEYRYLRGENAARLQSIIGGIGTGSGFRMLREKIQGPVDRQEGGKHCD